MSPPPRRSPPLDADSPPAADGDHRFLATDGDHRSIDPDGGHRSIDPDGDQRFLEPVAADFFARDTLEVARELVGCLLSTADCAGVVVETEAYRDDAASHWVTRPRTAALMGTSHGLVYVYRIYGVHHCLNFTTDVRAPGAVLIRALRPLEGLDVMAARRRVEDPRRLCAGPGCVAAALDARPEHTGSPVTDLFEIRPPLRRPVVVAGPRVGISAATDLPWRFAVAGSRWVSRPRLPNPPPTMGRRA